MYEFIRIGMVLKPHRKNGEFLADIDPRFFDDLQECQAVFLQIDGLEVPFFLESLDLDASGSYLKLEEFSAPEHVKPFNNTPLFLRKEDLVKAGSEGHQKEEMLGLTGFTLIDDNTGAHCTILSVEEYPQQLMALVAWKGSEALVPLAEDYILSVNPEKKEIVMELPEGLLEG